MHCWYHSVEWKSHVLLYLRTICGILPVVKLSENQGEPVDLGVPETSCLSSLFVR